MQLKRGDVVIINTRETKGIVVNGTSVSQKSSSAKEIVLCAEQSFTSKEQLQQLYPLELNCDRPTHLYEEQADEHINVLTRRDDTTLD